MHRTLGRVTTHRARFTGRALRHGFGGQGLRCSRTVLVHLVQGLNFGAIASFCRDVTGRSVSIGSVVSGCLSVRGQRARRHRRVDCHDTRNFGVRRPASTGSCGSSILIVSQGLGKLSFALTEYYGPVCNSRIFKFIDVGNNVGVRHYSYPGTGRVHSHFPCHVIGTH